MNTCKTCKWWGSPGTGHARANHCENPKSIPLEKVLGGSDIPDDWVATNFDDADCHGTGIPVFITGPDFGCIHHEPGKHPNRED